MKIILDGYDNKNIEIDEDLEPTFRGISIKQKDNIITFSNDYQVQELIDSLKFLIDHGT